MEPRYAPGQTKSTTKKRGAAAVFRVFRQLENGEFVHVASRDELEQAVQLVEALNAHWPGEYVVRDSEGNDVELR